MERFRSRWWVEKKPCGLHRPWVEEEEVTEEEEEEILPRRPPRFDLDPLPDYPAHTRPPLYRHYHRPLHSDHQRLHDRQPRL